MLVQTSTEHLKKSVVMTMAEEENWATISVSGDQTPLHMGPQHLCPTLTSLSPSCQVPRAVIVVTRAVWKILLTITNSNRFTYPRTQGRHSALRVRIPHSRTMATSTNNSNSNSAIDATFGSNSSMTTSQKFIDSTQPRLRTSLIALLSPAGSSQTHLLLLFLLPSLWLRPLLLVLSALAP
jgi:hypothetical protein